MTHDNHHSARTRPAGSRKHPVRACAGADSGYRAEIICQRKRRLLGTARVEIGAPRAALGVPVAALRAGKGAEVEVIVCGADGLAHARAFPRGATAGGLSETRGLGATDQVVVEPVVGVADGEPIELLK